MNTTLPLRRIRDFGEKVTDTIKFIKLNWKNLLVLYGVFVLPFLLIGVFLGAGYFMQIFSAMTAGKTNDLFNDWKIWVAILVIYMAVNGMATSIYLYMKVWEDEDRRATPGELLKVIAGPFLSNMLYSVLMFVGLMLLMVPIIMVASGTKSAGSVAFLGLFMLIAMIGLLILFPYLMLIYPVNTIGKVALGNAFRGTAFLLRGNWWASLGYVMVLFIIYYIFSFLVQMMLTLIFGAGALMGAENAGETFGKGLMVVYGLSMLIQQVFYIIMFVGAGVLYYSLHEEKVGGGLEKMIDDLGTGSSKYRQQEEY
ncbi:MAG: hypothetical protein ACK54A_16325 [Sphingobacteriales bacterium]